MLEITETNDARCAMRGAAVVTGRKALDSQHTFASTRQMMKCRTPHCAEPADHDVEMSHGEYSRKSRGLFGQDHAAEQSDRAPRGLNVNRWRSDAAERNMNGQT